MGRKLESYSKAELCGRIRVDEGRCESLLGLVTTLEDRIATLERELAGLRATISCEDTDRECAGTSSDPSDTILSRCFSHQVLKLRLEREDLERELAEAKATTRMKQTEYDGCKEALRQVTAERNAALERLAEANQWISDMQADCYINCVYCGHRYGPDDEHAATLVDDGATPTMQDALKAHIEQCPKHPMSQLKRERDAALKRLRWVGSRLRNAGKECTMAQDGHAEIAAAADNLLSTFGPTLTSGLTDD